MATEMILTAIYLRVSKKDYSPFCRGMADMAEFFVVLAFAAEVSQQI